MNKKGRGRRIVAGLIILSLALIALGTSILFLHTPDDRITWLHVDGNQIKNEHGETILLRGSALPDLSWRTRWAQGSADGTSEALTHRINQLVALTEGRCNVLRIAISPGAYRYFPENEYEGWTTTLIDPENNTWETEVHPEIRDPQVDAIVDLAEANNIHLILSFMGGLARGDEKGSPNVYTSALAEDPTPLIDWWLHWAERYKDRPVVAGFELWNEPWADAFGYWDYHLGRERYKNMILETARAIHEVNPKALIIFTASPWSYIEQYWIDMFQQEHPLPNNMLYGWHAYYKQEREPVKAAYSSGDWELAYEEYKRMLDWRIGDAIRAGMPVIETEFTWYQNTEEGLEEPAWDRAMHDHLSIINEWETNWMTWGWWSNPRHGMASGGNYSELSPIGEIWEQYLWDGPPPRFSVVEGISTVLIAASVVPAVAAAISIFPGKNRSRNRLSNQ